MDATVETDDQQRAASRARDVYDPVPEPKWVFRRLTVWASLVASLGLVAFTIFHLARLGDAGALKTLALFLIGKNILVLTIYLVAPSAEYVRRIGEVVTAIRS